MYIGLNNLGLSGLRGTSFSPATLFQAGQQGAWYDPSDFSILFQDSAGTVPVTAVGQPVGLILDKSGRGNHLQQTTTTRRPILQQDSNGFYYLSLDGVDDCLSSVAAFNMSASDKVSIFSGVTKLVSQGGSFVCELSTNSFSNAGAFGLDLNGAASNGDWPGALLYGSAGPAGIALDGAANTMLAGTSAVISMLGDCAGGITPQTQITIRSNGSSIGTGASSGSDTNGNMGAGYTLYVGDRAGSSGQLGGRIYQLVIRGGSSLATDVTLVERYIGGKMGIAL